MILLLPFYDLTWLAPVVEACRITPCTVIVNVWSGPGLREDHAWQAPIDKLRGINGTEILGYVDAIQFPNDGPVRVPRPVSKTTAQLLGERLRWRKFYGINAFFLDDVRQTPRIAPWQMLNPGCAPSFPLDSKTVPVVIFESARYTRSHAIPSVPTSRQAVIALGEKDFHKPLELASSRGVRYFFATPGQDDAQAYATPPPYLSNLAHAIRLIPNPQPRSRP